MLPLLRFHVLSESQRYTFCNPSAKISSLMFRSLSKLPLGSPSLTFCLAIQSARDAYYSHCNATSGTFSQNATTSWLEESPASQLQRLLCVQQAHHHVAMLHWSLVQVWEGEVAELKYILTKHAYLRTAFLLFPFEVSASFFLLAKPFQKNSAAYPRSYNTSCPKGILRITI